MGRVYRARRGESGRVVALKLGPTTQDSRRLERFRREGQITAELRHPNIVPVHDAGVVGNQPFLAYHLVDGARTLSEALPRWPLRKQIAALRDVAAALGHAHAQGVIHRDVKPENVLVTPEDTVLLADFGLASAGDFERMTLSNAMLGTPLYMAPELAHGGHRATGAADVYALGVVLYETLCGEHPFAHVGMPGLLAPDSRRFPSPHQKQPGVPRELSQLCMRALEVDPKRRFPDGAALCAALDGWLRGEAAPRPRRSLALPLALGVAALVVALGALAWHGVLSPAASTASTPRPSAEAQPAEVVVDSAPSPRPLTADEQEALSSAQALLSADAVDLRALQDLTPRLYGALSPDDPDHTAFADRLVRALREPDVRWDLVGLALLEDLARCGARPSDERLAERLCESLYWAKNREERFPSGQMLRGLVALVNLDVDVDGLVHAFDQDGDRTSGLRASPALSYLRARRQLELPRALREDDSSVTTLLSLARGSELGPVTRARALVECADEVSDPSRKLALTKEARALDPQSPWVELALAQALLWNRDLERGVPAHRAAWARWGEAQRGRAGSLEHERDLLFDSLRSMLRAGSPEEATALLDEHVTSWDMPLDWEPTCRAAIARFETDALLPVDERWLEGKRRWPAPPEPR